MITRSSNRSLQVGHRHWPATFEWSDGVLPDGKIFHVRWARVMLEGAAVQVKWGTNTYSTNYHEPFTEEPEIVEIAIVHGEGLYHLGYTDDAGLNAILDWLAANGDVKAMVEAWVARDGTLFH